MLRNTEPISALKSTLLFIIEAPVATDSSHGWHPVGIDCTRYPTPDASNSGKTDDLMSNADALSKMQFVSESRHWKLR